MRHRFGMLFLVSIFASAMLMSCSSQRRETPLLTGSTKDEIPWGFSERSYQMCESGALDSFIPDGSEAEQCAIADLNLDGIEDVILSYLIPNGTKDIDSYSLNTLILKGIGDGCYELAAENLFADKYSSYDGLAAFEARDGWFKFTRAGGYVYSY